MIRLFFCTIIIILVGIYSIPEAIVCFFVKKLSDNAVRNYRHAFIRFVFKCFIFVAGIKLTVNGIENIDEASSEKSVFIISNHRGIFDIITGYSLLKFPCGIVAKDSLAHIPILSYWMRNIDCIFLDRKDLRAGAMMVIKSIQNIDSGLSMWVFPEGTRSKGDDPYNDILEFKSGAFKIPEKADCKILPMAIVGAEKIFENQAPFIKSGEIKINIGKMYKISELEEDDKLDLGIYNRDLVKALISKKE